MTPRLADSRRWTASGTALIAGLLAEMEEGAYGADCLLPGWSRRHLIAHLANNAVALGNLVHWAATGEVTPMYTSVEKREADIERDAQLDEDALTRRFIECAEDLGAAMARLAPDDWRAQVHTIRGEAIEASVIPWLRAREVMIHAVDLDLGVDFDDLPPEFLTALCADICTRRTSMGGDPPMLLRAGDSPGEWSIGTGASTVRVAGSRGAIAAYLAGRGTAGVTAEPGDVPVLGPWL